MLASIRTKYWWPSIKSDVERHCGNCRQCKLRKADTHAARLPLLRSPIPSYAFQYVNIDLTGRFSMCTNRWEYILVCKCQLTLYVILIPIKNKSQEEVQQALVNRLFMVYGSVYCLISDNGGEFKGRLSDCINYLINNKHKTATAYNPAANAKVEQANATIKNMLSQFVSENQLDWDIYLPVIAYSYNTTIAASTGFSPFRALHGREAVQPAEEWIEEFATTKQVNITKYVNNLTKALLFTWQRAGDNIFQSQQAVDHRSPDIRERIFKPYVAGENFFYRAIPKRYLNKKGEKKLKLNLKLQDRWTGPHIIIETLNPILYRALVNNREKTVHAIRMKRDVNVKERFVPLIDVNVDQDSDSLASCLKRTKAIYRARSDGQ